MFLYMIYKDHIKNKNSFDITYVLEVKTPTNKHFESPSDFVV